ASKPVRRRGRSPARRPRPPRAPGADTMPSDVAGPFTPDPSRRRFLAAAGALAAGALLPARLRPAAAADPPGARAFTLTAAPARGPLLAGQLDQALAGRANAGRAPG